MTKSKKRFVVINGIVCAFLAALFIAANIVMSVFFGGLTMYFGGMGLDLDNPDAEAVREEATEFTKTITGEGITLLRNEGGALPLDEGNVNLFGWSSTALITGGTGGSGGSGGADETIRSSLEDAGFTINADLWDMYVRYQDGRQTTKEGGPSNTTYTVNWGTPEPAIGDASYYTPQLLADAQEFSDTAIFVIGRSSGEGLDIPEGQLSLTQEEKDLAAYLTDTYDTVVAVINSNSVMELGYLEEAGVEAILFMPGTGAYGVGSLGKILSGEINPSGHLVDTMAYDHKSAPNYYYANRQGTRVYSGMDVTTYNDANSYYYVDYVEGIYVGYKWYETAAAEGYIDYDETVQYPFGHGLSYTTFEKEVTDVRGDLRSDAIEIDVRVTNTGDAAGKDVVQIYATPEYYEGGIEKAYVDLVGFEKTSLLAPDASETVTVTVDPFEIASYDWNDANNDGSTGYILEHGTYELKLMENAHDLIAVAETYELNDDIRITEDPVTGAEIKNLFDDVAGQEETEPVEYLCRADFAGTFPEANTSLVGRAASAAVKAAADTDVQDGDIPAITTGANNGVTVEDVKLLDPNDPLWDDLLDNLTVEEMVPFIVDARFVTPEIERIGLNGQVMIDGPQGLNGWMVGISGTSYPVQEYVALTWNKEIAAKQGELLAREARTSNVSGLLAPAANIHRTPYCGRNFEYYSEDGFLSGKMAAQMSYAAREQGVTVFVKHFALNDQEQFRGEYYTSLFTWSNEQAMREIYLKPFELAVKEGRTTGIMSSFNRVGSTWTGASKALLTDLLRTEWGFKGSVVTDLYVGAMNNEWWMDIEQGIRAGNDMWLTAFVAGEIDSTDPGNQYYMRECMRHIIYTISQSTVSPQTPEPTWFYTVALPIDIVAGVLILGYAGFILYKGLKKDKQDN